MKLTAKFIPLVSPFMATGDIRYYLNGINVHPHPEGGALITATNGHVMGVAYDREAEIENELILRLTKGTVAACAKRKDIEYRTLELRNDRLVVIEPSEKDEIHIQAGNPIIEGKYPNFRNVIPDANDLMPGLVGAFNAEYLSLMDEVAKAARKMGFGIHDYAEFFNVNGCRDKCAVVRLCNVSDFVGIIMPCHWEVEGSLPEWINALPKEEKLAA